MALRPKWRGIRSALAITLGLSMASLLITEGVSSASSTPAAKLTGVAKAAQTFYKGKTITLYIPFAPGGGTDQYGRIFGQYVQQFIPGHPTIIVKNLTGAGGLTAMQEVNQVLPADGMTMVLANSVIPLIVLVGESGSNFGLDKMDPIFDVGAPTTIFTLNSVAKNLAQLKAYAKTHQITMSFTSPGSTGQAFNYLALQLLGIPSSQFKSVDGFTGLGAPVALAMQQGSIDLSGDPPAGYTASFLPLQKQGLITPIVQTGTVDSAGNINPMPGFKPNGVTVPTIKQLYQSINKGKAPGGLLWEAMKVLVGDLFVNTGEVFLTRTGTPAAALYALREGFQKLSVDKSVVNQISNTLGAKQIMLNYQQAGAALKALNKVPTSVVHVLGCDSGVYPPSCLNTLGK